MNSAFDIIKSLLRTEKSTALYEPKSKYLFLVSSWANKIQIKQAVEEIYKVEVKQVNTYLRSGKIKRVRQEAGRTPDLKKVIVTLKQGQKIEAA